MMLDSRSTDTGDIVDQQTVAITPRRHLLRPSTPRWARPGPRCSGASSPALLAGTAPRPAAGFRADGPPLPKRTPGMGITDWNRPARAVHDWIRALTWPYPGAFTFRGDQKIMLWAAAPEGASRRRSWRRARCSRCGEDGVRVATADGTILLTSASDPGGPARAEASAWAARSGLRPGVRFEPVPPETAAWALGLGPKPAENVAR